MSKISVTTNSVVKTIAVGDQPIGIAITPDGTKAYVATSGINKVTVINTATGTTTTDTVVSTVSVGRDPRHLAIEP